MPNNLVVGQPVRRVDAIEKIRFIHRTIQD
jgi:hypothetical protein